jgi:hypothetical protein
MHYEKEVSVPLKWHIAVGNKCSAAFAVNPYYRLGREYADGFTA